MKNHEEYRQLLKETLLLFEEIWNHERNEPFLKTASLIKETCPLKVPSLETTQLNPKSPLESPPLPPPTEKKITPPIEEKTPLKTKQNSFSGKEKALEEMVSTLSHVSPHLKLLNKPTCVYLIHFKDNEDDIKFLTALSKAINESLEPCSVIYCKQEKEFQKILTTPFLKLALVVPLAPSNAPLHRIEGKVMTLASVNDYQTDIELKRSLWNTLKNHFLPQSSSILRSTKP